MVTDVQKCAEGGVACWNLKGILFFYITSHLVTI